MVLFARWHAQNCSRIFLCHQHPQFWFF